MVWFALGPLRVSRSSLRFSEFTPAFRAHIRAYSDADTPRSLIASRAPGPTGSARDGKVIPSEAEPCGNDTNEAAKEQVEAKVAEVCEACAADVDCGTDGYEDENERVDGWSSGLVPDRHNLLPGGGRQAGLLVVQREKRFVSEIGRRDRGRVRRIRAEWSRWEEGDGDGELGCEKERQVEQTRP
jgi:hypothetical protein